MACKVAAMLDHVVSTCLPAFSITLGVLPSIIATQELVVPKSIPILLCPLLISILLPPTTLRCPLVKVVGYNVLNKKLDLENFPGSRAPTRVLYNIVK